MSATDFYSVLEVERDADSITIRKAFKKLALLYHPDKVPETEREDAEIKFKVISEAYEVLGNEEKRMIYDAEIHFSAETDGAWHDFYADPSASEYQEEYNNEGEYADYSQNYGYENTNFKTKDVTYEIEMTLAEIYRGEVLKLNLERKVTCRKCNGTGGKRSTNTRTCTTCKGDGYTKEARMAGPNLWYSDTAVCHSCKGFGKEHYNLTKCKTCKGSCEQILKSIVEVYIPKGVKNNHRIVLEGQADEEMGKVTGDLVVVVQVNGENETFRREGLDLYTSAPISLRESLSGFSKPLITHLDGRELQVTVEKGTILWPGSILKIPKEGLIKQASDGEEVFGDMYIQIDVEFPKKLPTSAIDQLLTLIDGDNTSTTAPQSEAKSSEFCTDVNYEILNESDLPKTDPYANDEPDPEPEQAIPDASGFSPKCTTQ